MLAAMNRRTFLQATATGAASLALSHNSFAADANPDLGAIQKEIEKRHDESVQRLQAWIRQPSIAAEHRGMDEGCDLAMRMLSEAGFQGSHEGRHRWPARHLRHARRRRAAHSWDLLHV